MKNVNNEIFLSTYVTYKNRKKKKRNEEAGVLS